MQVCASGSSTRVLDLEPEVTNRDHEYLHSHGSKHVPGMLGQDGPPAPVEGIIETTSPVASSGCRLRMGAEGINVVNVGQLFRAELGLNLL